MCVANLESCGLDRLLRNGSGDAETPRRCRSSSARSWCSRLGSRWDRARRLHQRPGLVTFVLVRFPALVGDFLLLPGRKAARTSSIATPTEAARSNAARRAGRMACGVVATA